MTTLQKTLLATAFVAATGMALVEARRNDGLRDQILALRKQGYQLSDQLVQLQQERAAAKIRDAALLAENEQLKSRQNSAELMKLRGEVSQLHPLQKDLAALQKLASQSVPGMQVWKPEQIKNVGRATPQDALQTFLWSSMTTNSNELRNSLVGDASDPPDPEAIRKYAEDSSNIGLTNPGFSGFKVLAQTLLSPNDAVLEVEIGFDESGAGVAAPLTLRNVDGEWKVVLYNTRDADGKVTRLELLKKPPAH